MTKRLSAFRRVIFEWEMPPEERHQVEETLRSMGYEVDGGGTNLADRISEIFVRPRRRAKKKDGNIPEE